MIRLALLMALLAQPAAAVERFICWRGANGYTMTGVMTFPDTLAGADLIDGSEVTGFAIEGWKDGAPIGRWNLDQRQAGTNWLMRYSPAKGRFPLLGGGIYQAWNAGGKVDDCGTPGFGFNAGNAGQDICVDGRFVRDSTIDPTTPILTYPAPRDPRDCSSAPMMSKRR